MKSGMGLSALVLAASVAAAEVELVSTQTPLRVYLTTATAMPRESGGGGATSIWIPEGYPAAGDAVRYLCSPVPPADWRKADFEDTAWARYSQDDLAEFLSPYGIDAGAADSRTPWPALLCVRTCFGVADPARATDLKVVVSLLGGAVVFVNGQEVGRGFMPAGEVGPVTHAEAYPAEAYGVADAGAATPTVDGKMQTTVKSLPPLGEKREPDPNLISSYEKRIRTFTVKIPPQALVKGRNVLAVEAHRAAIGGTMPGGKGWSHLGFREIRVTGAGGAGGIPYAQAMQGTHVWSANAVDQVTETPSAKSLIKRGWFWTLYWGRGMPVKGIVQGNPFDPVLPVKITMPRNGVGSGQTVLSDPAGLRGMTAALGPLQGPGGAVLPAHAAQIRYAVQHPGVHYCDGLVEKAPDGAKTVPVWLMIQAPKNQAPGWYVSTLNLEANGRKLSVPVRVLVTGLVLPDAKDFFSTVGFTQSPDTVAKQYNVELWSDAHWKRMEKSFALLAQVGNDAVHVPVIVSGVGGTGKSGVRFGWEPMVRWVKDGAGVKPDFTILEKYLDLYAKHCAPPRGISFYVWGAGSAKEHADAYENRRIPSRENTKYSPPQVALWDPQAGKTSPHTVPAFGDEGDEAFWKPFLDGARALVVKRGWSERVIMLGLGGDIRPGQKTAERLKQWAPYARWDFLSHFSGDPGPSNGVMIATGGMEVGMKEYPGWTSSFRLADFEGRVAKPYDFLDLPTDRWMHQEYSPPLIFRTMTANWGSIGRIGLDFWMARSGGQRSSSFFSHIESLTIPGPDGAVPTVRFQMLREGVQDAEVKAMMVKAYLSLPEERRKVYRALLDELPRRMGLGAPSHLSQHELGYDWPAYVARLHEAAAELAGLKTDAKWEEPPKQ